MLLSALILRPLIGAVIGYITNDIAIRMLFRPRTAKYLFGVRIPFTPGIIPKEKTRIAASLGDAISRNLMNQDVLKRTLLSQEMIGKLSAAIDEFAHTQMNNPETLRQALEHYVQPSEIEAMATGITQDLGRHVQKALANSDLGSKLSHIIVAHVLDKMKVSLLSVFGADQFISLLTDPAEKLLAKHINEMLDNHSGTMAAAIVGNQIEQFLDMPVRRILQGHQAQIDQARTAIVSLYKQLVTERLPRILQTLDISRIVETRINEMDERESERLILTVMARELKAIVWLGALLGFLMGCVNLLF